MKDQGFTLLETIIYLALFALVIGGGLLAVFQIIQGSESNDNQIAVFEEANFLLHKIDWALTGASNIDVLGNSFTVTKNSELLKFSVIGTDLKLQRDAGPEVILNSGSTAISAFSFTKLAGSGGHDGISIQLTISSRQGGRNFSQNFSIIRYLRL